MKRIKVKLRYYFAILLYLFKFTPIQRNKNNNFINIINFHYFLDKNDKFFDHSLEVSIDIFKKQIKTLSNFFNFLSVEKDLNIFFKNNNKPNNKASIIITVDDADYNLIKIIPIIEKYNLPLVIFAPIGFCLAQTDIAGIRSRCLHYAFFEYKKKNIKNLKEKLTILFDKLMLYDYNYLNSYYHKLINNKNDIFLKKKFLSSGDLKKLASHPLITIASHSMSHVPLSLIPDKWLKWEISESCKYIEKYGGNNLFFAYPYGYKNSFNDNTKKILKLYGINFAFTTIANITSCNSDSLELGRTLLFNFKNINYLMGTACGAFAYYDKILNR